MLSESVVGERSFASMRVEAVTAGVRAAPFALPDIMHDDEGMRIDVGMGDVRLLTPEGRWRAEGESRVYGKEREREGGGL